MVGFEGRSARSGGGGAVLNIGPYFVRRTSSLSAPGDPGICFESELCLRAWTKGYRVGYSFVPLGGAAGQYAMDGGTMPSRRTNESATALLTAGAFSSGTPAER